LISKIENDELKDEYLKKLKKTMNHDFENSVKPKTLLMKLWKGFLNKNPK